MRPHSGAALIEVLISLIIFSIFLLGLDAMQLTSLQMTKKSYYAALAQAQLEFLQERMLVLNENQFGNEIEKWNKQLNKLLPNGRGEMNANNIAKIYWGNATESDCPVLTNHTGCIQMMISQ